MANFRPWNCVYENNEQAWMNFWQYLSFSLFIFVEVTFLLVFVFRWHWCEVVDIVAAKAVVEYLNRQNRPYSAIDIFNNLHKEYGKTVCLQLSLHNYCQLLVTAWPIWKFLKLIIQMMWIMMREGFFFLGKINGKKRNKLQIRLITHLDLWLC